MNISDFARSRGVQPQAVSRYIQRNKDKFEGHIANAGKSIILDDYALELLNTKYQPPLAIYGVPKEEYDELKGLYDLKQLQLTEAQKAVESAQARADQYCEQLEELKGVQLLLETTKQDNDRLSEQIDEYKSIQSDQNIKIGHLNAEIEQKNAIIKEYEDKAKEEAAKTKWQRFKELWK